MNDKLACLRISLAESGMKLLTEFSCPRKIGDSRPFWGH
ncbi:Uncharacterized protein dnm_095820 [Desulfonema magnum]|uniref:Uncharacterized protein n=1 Tax=Desulfonema magnum TaxID=45655 RepID=A0A975BXE4_9BACT|nr:Uncharacterized protein dnm_095820 [Desulfonema magnum]